MILNTAKLSPAAYDRLNTLDTTFIGTPDYMGLAFFWNYKYRHSLRDADTESRRIVHEMFLDARLAPNGDSIVHDAIVNRVFPNAV